MNEIAWFNFTLILGQVAVFAVAFALGRWSRPKPKPCRYETSPAAELPKATARRGIWERSVIGGYIGRAPRTNNPKPPVIPPRTDQRWQRSNSIRGKWEWTSYRTERDYDDNEQMP